MKELLKTCIVFCSFTLTSTHAFSQITLWLENFENNCNSGCTTYTSANGTWTFVVSPAAPAGLCGYASPNGASANMWYVSCAENGSANTVCSAGCGSNESLHMGSVTLGDLGAAYDAARTTCKMAQSPNITTSAAGGNALTLTFEYIQFGQGTTDCAQLLYSIDGGVNWNFLSNPLPVTTCCGGACNGQNQGRWTTTNFALPATCNNITTLKIGFNWKNNNSAGTDPSFAVNDVRITYNSVLPIELITFSGHQHDKTVQVEWKTASETDNAYFEVEKSTDGENYSLLGKVDSKGNSQHIQSYTLTDTKPGSGTNYYRLKQVDLNGTSSVSNSIAVDYTANGDNPLTMTCTFNSEGLVTFLQANTDLTVNFEVFDITGKSLVSKNYILKNGKNKITWPMSGGSTGTYLVVIKDKEGQRFSYSQKAVKSTHP